MSAYGLPVIDEAVHGLNRWLNEIDARTGWGNKQRAYRLLRAVLHTLRDHLGVEEAAQLSAQLPIMVRGIYFEGWDPSRVPVRMRRAEEFVAAVQSRFETDPMADAGPAIAAVIAVLRGHVSAGEMEDVESAFTADIRSLFD